MRWPQGSDGWPCPRRGSHWNRGRPRDRSRRGHSPPSRRRRERVRTRRVEGGAHGTGAGTRQTAQTRPAEPRWNRWKGQNPAVDLLEPPRACSVMFEPDATHWARSTHHPVQNDEEMGGRAISTGGVARVATLALTVPVHWPAWNPAAQPMKKGRLGGGKTETPRQCGTAVDRQPHRRATDKSEPTLVRGHLRVVDVRDTRATLSNRGRRRERETLPSSLPALQASNVPAW